MHTLYNIPVYLLAQNKTIYKQNTEYTKNEFKIR